MGTTDRRSTRAGLAAASRRVRRRGAGRLGARRVPDRRAGARRLRRTDLELPTRYGRETTAAAQAVSTTHDVGSIPVDPGRYLIQLAPNRIDIPRLKASAPIVDVGTTPDGELDVPINPRVAGWWSPGAKPGAKVGTALIAGHINYAGVTGTFARIGTLRPGDVVDVYGKQNAAPGMVRFRVTGVRSYKKTALPYKEIFDQKSVGRLALVTCGGAFDTSTGNYLENIVVFAVPIASKAL